MTCWKTQNHREYFPESKHAYFFFFLNDTQSTWTKAGGWVGGGGVQFNLTGEIFGIMDLIFHRGSFVSAQNQQRQSGRQRKHCWDDCCQKVRWIAGLRAESYGFQLPALHHRAGECAANEAASRRVIARGGAGSSPTCLLINERLKRVADLLIDLLNKLIKPINLFKGVAAS